MKKIVLPRPYYDASRRILFYGQGESHVLRGATTQHLIVLAFQAAGWPHELPNPFGGTSSANRIRKALKRLNVSLSGMDFHLYRGGLAICWRVLPPFCTPPKFRAGDAASLKPEDQEAETSDGDGEINESVADDADDQDDGDWCPGDDEVEDGPSTEMKETTVLAPEVK